MLPLVSQGRSLQDCGGEWRSAKWAGAHGEGGAAVPKEQDGVPEKRNPQAQMRQSLCLLPSFGGIWEGGERGRGVVRGGDGTCIYIIIIAARYMYIHTT